MSQGLYVGWPRDVTPFATGEQEYGNAQMKKLITAAMVATISLAGCAQRADQIEASYVSSTIYKGQTCQQLISERNEIVARVNDLAADQNESATTDAVAMGVGLVLFWPALFVLAATDDNKAELAAAKGNYDAINAAAKQRKCPNWVD